MSWVLLSAIKTVQNYHVALRKEQLAAEIAAEREAAIAVQEAFRRETSKDAHHEALDLHLPRLNLNAEPHTSTAGSSSSSTSTSTSSPSSSSSQYPGTPRLNTSTPRAFLKRSSNPSDTKK